MIMLNPATPSSQPPLITSVAENAVYDLQG